MKFKFLSLTLLLFFSVTSFAQYKKTYKKYNNKYQSSKKKAQSKDPYLDTVKKRDEISSKIAMIKTEISESLYLLSVTEAPDKSSENAVEVVPESTIDLVPDDPTSELKKEEKSPEGARALAKSSEAAAEESKSPEVASDESYEDRDAELLNLKDKEVRAPSGVVEKGKSVAAQMMGSNAIRLKNRAQNKLNGIEEAQQKRLDTLAE